MLENSDFLFLPQFYLNRSCVSAEYTTENAKKKKKTTHFFKKILIFHKFIGFWFNKLSTNILFIFLFVSYQKCEKFAQY